MKMNWKPWVLALGAFALTLATAPAALASCGSVNLPLPHHSGFQLAIRWTGPAHARRPAQRRR